MSAIHPLLPQATLRTKQNQNREFCCLIWERLNLCGYSSWCQCTSEGRGIQAEVFSSMHQLEDGTLSSYSTLTR